MTINHNRDAAQAISAPVAAAIRASDAAALRAALRYPDASDSTDVGAQDTSVPLEQLASSLKLGFRMSKGPLSTSLMELCYGVGRVDLFKLVLEAQHLPSALWPDAEPEKRRRLWQSALATHAIGADGLLRQRPIKIALDAVRPHTVDFLRVLIEFQEPDWGPLATHDAGAALLREARMRTYIEARLADTLGTAEQVAKGAPSGQRARARAL